MRTQKYIQVEALVAKYKNNAKNSNAVIEAKKAFADPFAGGLSRHDTDVCDFEHQLLAHFYALTTAKSLDAQLSKDWNSYSLCYQSGILTGAFHLKISFEI